MAKYQQRRKHLPRNDFNNQYLYRDKCLCKNMAAEFSTYNFNEGLSNNRITRQEAELIADECNRRANHFVISKKYRLTLLSIMIAIGFFILYCAFKMENDPNYQTEQNNQNQVQESTENQSAEKPVQETSTLEKLLAVSLVLCFIVCCIWGCIYAKFHYDYQIIISRYLEEQNMQVWHARNIHLTVDNAIRYILYASPQQQQYQGQPMTYQQQPMYQQPVRQQGQPIQNQYMQQYQNQYYQGQQEVIEEQPMTVQQDLLNKPLLQEQ